MRRITSVNDWLIEYDAVRPNSTTGEDEVATGLTGLVGFLSLTRDGVTIDATLSVALQERSSTPGRYYGVLDRADLVAHLPAAGTIVWEVVDDTANLRRVTMLRVVEALEASA